MRLKRSIILLVPILIAHVWLRAAAAESLKKAAGRIKHQADVNFSHVEHETQVNGSHLSHHVQQETHNFFRMIFEDRCDEVRRNQGAEQGQECENETKANGIGPHGPPAQANERYLAAAEVDCYKPGYDGRWGSEDIYVWSKTSKEDAQQAIKNEISSNRVCRTRGHDSNLTDGESRWLNE